MPTGANNTPQPATKKSGNVSATVGRLSIPGARSDQVEASILMMPPRIADDLLAPDLAELVGNDASGDVIGAADRRIRYDPDRLFG